MNKTTTLGIVAIIGLVAVMNVASLANGQIKGAQEVSAELYEDATSEFMEENGQIINMYEFHEDGAVTITSNNDNSGNVLYEDEMGEYLANAGFNMTEFSPEGGRNGELLIVADPMPMPAPIIPQLDINTTQSLGLVL